MPRFRFIHAADVHIDSPLQGLSAYEGAPVDELRKASRAAFTRLIDLAIEQEVHFVVIAGDLFDGPWKDVSTGLWTFQQFRRLGEKDIPLYLLRGNHDAASEILTALPFPKNVHCFDHKKAETFRLQEIKAALHGRSFPTGAVDFDITEDYPAAVPGWFNVGVLHTSLAGNAMHDTYAPTDERRLCGLGYDYWALGHIHAGQILREADPVIAYSGACQGRHVNEPGAKGCYMVDVDSGGPTMEFCPLDGVRWFRAAVDVREADAPADIAEKAAAGLQSLQEENGDRLLAVRLVLHGTCGLPGLLGNPKEQDELIAMIHNEANAIGGTWIERVEFAMTPPMDGAALRARGDLLAEVLRELDSMMDSPESLDALRRVLESQGGAAESAILKGGRAIDAACVRSWLERTERYLAASLGGTEVENH